jgi:hypothetical protein
VPGDFAPALRETGLLASVAEAPRVAPQPAEPSPRPAPQPAEAARPAPAARPAQAAQPAAAPRPAPTPARPGWTRWLIIAIVLVLLIWLVPRLFRGEPEPAVEPEAAPEAAPAN